MKPIIISKSEAKILHRDLRFPWHILVTLIIVIVFALVYCYLAFFLESNAITEFSSMEMACPDIQVHINKMFRKLTTNTIKPALFFFSITVGVLVGFFINHIRRSNVLKKLKIEQSFSINGEQQD